MNVYHFKWYKNHASLYKESQNREEKNFQRKSLNSRKTLITETMQIQLNYTVVVTWLVITINQFVNIYQCLRQMVPSFKRFAVWQHRKLESDKTGMLQVASNITVMYINNLWISRRSLIWRVVRTGQQERHPTWVFTLKTIQIN